VGPLSQDVAIVASIALQSGCPLEVLRHALVGLNGLLVSKGIFWPD
jgi:hypothetical protein